MIEQTISGKYKVTVNKKYYGTLIVEYKTSF